jgi:hypothetical protein
MPENIESADDIEERETAEFNLSMEIYQATQQLLMPPTRMLIRRFLGQHPPDNAPPEVKRAWELKYR